MHTTVTRRTENLQQILTTNFYSFHLSTYSTRGMETQGMKLHLITLTTSCEVFDNQPCKYEILRD